MLLFLVLAALTAAVAIVAYVLATADDSMTRGAMGVLAILLVVATANVLAAVA